MATEANVTTAKPKIGGAVYSAPLEQHCQLTQLQN